MAYSESKAAWYKKLLFISDTLEMLGVDLDDRLKLLIEIEEYSQMTIALYLNESEGYVVTPCTKLADLPASGNINDMKFKEGFGV